MQFDGKQYGVPTDLSLHFMYYRKDLIDALLGTPAGRRNMPRSPRRSSASDCAARIPTAGPGTTARRPRSSSPRAVNPDSPTRYGTVLQMKNLLFNMMVCQSTPRSYGGDWMDDEGEITVDTPAFRKGLELYKTLYDAGATPKDSLTYEYAEANAAFGSGQAATMLQWNAACRAT